jgi:hypothetical protein
LISAASSSADNSLSDVFIVQPALLVSGKHIRNQHTSYAAIDNKGCFKTTRNALMQACEAAFRMEELI